MNLFSRLFEVPEEYVACYLDMYYQIRLRAEQEKADCQSGAADGGHNHGDGGGRQIAAPTEKTETMPVGGGVPGAPRTLDEGFGRLIAQASSECRALLARQDAPAEKTETMPVGGGVPDAPRTLDEGFRRQIAQASSECRALPARQNAPAETTEVDPAPAAPAIAKKHRSKSKGNDYAAKAAAFKREVREKLLEMRKEGLSSPLIIKKSNWNITESQLADILDAKPVPVAVYRVLAATLDVIEKDNALPAASAE